MAKYKESNSSGKLLKQERSRWTFFGLPFTFTKYTLTEKKLILNKGFLNTTEDEVLLYRVMDITKRRTLGQRIFGLGSIIVSSQDKTIPTLVIKNIKNYSEFADALSEQIESDKLRLGVRRGEFVGGNMGSDHHHHMDHVHDDGFDHDFDHDYDHDFDDGFDADHPHDFDNHGH